MYRVSIKSVLLLLVVTGLAAAGCSRGQRGENRGDEATASSGSDESHGARLVSWFEATEKERGQIEGAVNGNDPALMRETLAAGANPNILMMDGSTYVHSAAAMGETEILELMIEHGGLVNVSNTNGWTPLHCVAYYMQGDAPGVIRVLLDGGANVDAKTNQRMTALDIARAELAGVEPTSIKAARARECIELLSQQSE